MEARAPFLSNWFDDLFCVDWVCRVHIDSSPNCICFCTYYCFFKVGGVGWGVVSAEVKISSSHSIHYCFLFFHIKMMRNVLLQHWRDRNSSGGMFNSWFGILMRGFGEINVHSIIIGSWKMPTCFTRASMHPPIWIFLSGPSSFISDSMDSYKINRKGKNYWLYMTTMWRKYNIYVHVQEKLSYII